MSIDTVFVNACDLVYAVFVNACAGPMTWVLVLEAGLWLTLGKSRMKREKGGAEQLWEEEEPVDTGKSVPTSDAASVGSHL